MEMKQFAVGEHVIYGANGICTVEDIVLQSPVAGAPACRYYILRQMENKGLTISVPTQSETLLKRMRRVFTKTEIDALLSGAYGREQTWIDDKRERADAFRLILSGGITEELILMIRCIYLRRQMLAKHSKKLNVSDENTLKSAEKLVREEFAYALGIEPDAVGRYIRNALRFSVQDDPA